jgi:2,4-diketo-3-deoxy-L-fuconate hydrolase
MKLIRFGKTGEEKPGIAMDDVFYDVSGFGEDYDENFFEAGGLRRLEIFLKANKNTLPRIGSNIRL